MKKPVIICIDDESAVLESLKLELKQVIGEECIIETAEGGEEALELLADLQADDYDIALVFSDYIMPDIKGDELLKQIHQMSPQTLKIMLTGQADLEAIGNAIKYAKLYRYIPKPWQLEDLKLTVVDAVHSYLQDKKLAEQNLRQQKINEELKKINEALSQSENRLIQFLDALPVGVAVHKDNGTVAYLNQTGKKLFNFEDIPESSPEQLASAYQIYLSGTDRLCPIDNLPIVRALRGETVIMDDLEVRRDDRIIPFEIRTTPIIDANGKIIYAISAFQDISQRKQAEELLANYNRTLETEVQQRTQELEKAKKAAETADRAKTFFLAKMSHELRTPLNAILGFSQTIARSSNLTLQQKDNLSIIRSNGEHLLNLIEQVLDLSKIEAGQMSLNQTNFDLYQLLDEMAKMFQLKAKQKGLQLNYDFTPEVPQYIQTDRIKLRQILINLLNNAIKFTQEGAVTIKVSLKQKPDLEREKHPTLGTLIFAVRDTGPGIAVHELDRLFQAFSQTSLGQKNQEGTGLGLTISRQFVQMMGGDIRVESEIDRGTLFTFEIQIKIVDAIDNYAQKITQQAIGLDANQPPYRILLVDDDRDNCQLLEQMLSPIGFELKKGNNGKEAIDLWQSWQPHLILMDLQMPVIDGYQAIRQIRSFEANNQSSLTPLNKGESKKKQDEPRVKIIAMTASILDRERIAAEEAGCDDFISKPFQENTIFNILQKHLGVRYIYQRQPVKKTDKSIFPFPSNSFYSSSLLNPPSIAENRERSQKPKLDRLVESKLSQDWVDRMKQAIVKADFTLISDLIEQIAERDRKFAQILQNLLNDFNYQKILSEIASREKEVKSQ